MDADSSSDSAAAPSPEPIAAPTEAPAADAADDEPRGEAPAPADLAPTVPKAAQPYRKADATARHAGTDILTASPTLLLRAIEEVVAAEAPLHFDDLVERVTEMWGLTRAGTRVMGRLEYAMKMAEQQGLLARRGKFVWPPSGAFAVRSRAGTGIPAERIPPEEYREAAVMVLRATGAVPRRELTNRVRALMGFSRTGPRLDEAIGAALESLLADGSAGEASTGIKLRE